MYSEGALERLFKAFFLSSLGFFSISHMTQHLVSQIGTSNDLKVTLYLNHQA